MPLRMLAAVFVFVGVDAPSSFLRSLETHCFFTSEKAQRVLGFTPKAAPCDTEQAEKADPPSGYAIQCVLDGYGTAAGFAAPVALLFSSLALLLYCDAKEAYLPSLFPALVSLLTLVTLVTTKATVANQPPLHPVQVAGGLPLLGNLLDFIKGPVGLIGKLRTQYRSMFTIKIGPQRVTFMIGAEAQRHFIKAKDEELDQAPVYSFTVPVFGKGIVYDSPLKERQQQVKMMVHSMNTASLEKMVPKIISEAEAYFAKWEVEGEVELRKVFAELIIMTASSTLMGREIRENLFNDVARIYHKLDGGLLPLSTIWPSAPVKAHRERDAAREEMVSIFSKVIAQRRDRTAAGAPKEEDFLQTMMDFRYKDSQGNSLRGFSDSEIVGLLIVILFAGQHTSSVTASWVGAMILSHPEALKQLREEQERLVPDTESMKYSNLMEMDYMRCTISEVLRLYPPLILLMRKVMTPQQVGAFVIPKGDVVGLCPPHSNMDPRYWHEPKKFKPERFASGGAEADTWSSRTVGHGINSGMMLAFGGGAHMCSGRRFGLLQVSVIWAILLRDFDLELLTKVPEPKYEDMVVGPADPIRIKYRRKEKYAAASTTSPSAA